MTRRFPFPDLIDKPAVAKILGTTIRTVEREAARGHITAQWRWHGHAFYCKEDALDLSRQRSARKPSTRKHYAALARKLELQKKQLREMQRQYGGTLKENAMRLFVFGPHYAKAKEIIEPLRNCRGRLNSTEGVSKLH